MERRYKLNAITQGLINITKYFKSIENAEINIINNKYAYGYITDLQTNKIVQQMKYFDSNNIGTCLSSSNITNEQAKAREPNKTKEK
jgi:hypothetical protein